MDNEQQRRREVIAALGSDFVCFEEVRLTHAMFSNYKVRADIVAVPLDERFWGYAIAFEVKEPEPTWNGARWSQVIRQASDYVYAKIDPQEGIGDFAGRRIAASFLYPSPPYRPFDGADDASEFVCSRDVRMAAGALHLALHFRVGHAYKQTYRSVEKFTLAFGPNEVWDSDAGFLPRGEGLLVGKRKIGSRKVDILGELDGVGSNVSWPEYE